MIYFDLKDLFLELKLELNKIPFMLIVGEKETKQKEISVRQQGEGDLGSFKINDFVKLINDKIDLDFKDLKI